MSVEDRLREGLARNAESFEPDVELSLAGVASRARRRSRRRRIAIGISAAAAVAAVVVGLLFVTRPHEGVRSTLEPGLTPGGSGPEVQALTGRFEATVASGAGGSLPFDVAGRWVLDLAADGSMRVTAPGTYVGVVSAPLFQATREWFRTSLFGTDLCSGLPPGTYRWSVTGSRLRFSELDDPCDGRVGVLASQEWSKIS
jgi:hypothetical protein